MTNLKIGNKIIWKNTNTNTIKESEVRGRVDKIVSLGGHYVSWLHEDDVEVLEVTFEKPKRKNYIKKGY